jgi:hypothetical protein
MTPSSEMNSVTTIRPMLDSPQKVTFGLAMQASIVVDRNYGKFSSVGQTHNFTANASAGTDGKRHRAWADELARARPKIYRE